MKFLIIVLMSVTLFSCASSNQVSSKKVDGNQKVAKNDGIVCKKSRKTGSRMNSTTCITKEQQARERKDSKDAMRNATNTQKNLVPGAVGK
jgi:hypothetical protein